MQCTKHTVICNRNKLVHCYVANLCRNANFSHVHMTYHAQPPLMHNVEYLPETSSV
jgi:hypothetical protein